MGCASSKQSVCRNCREPCSPLRRSQSVHVHHPPQRQGDSYHMVALTSSTLGSLRLDLDPFNRNLHINEENSPIEICDDRRKINPDVFDGEDKRSRDEFSMGVIEAKTWSRMIDEKIPKIVPRTPIRTPPGEPETINAWELMEGLEDISPLRLPNHIRSFSFHVSRNPILSEFDQPTPRVQENGESCPKPLWLDMADNDSNSNSTSVVSEFDPEVISTFRKALEDLPPANPIHLKLLESEKQQGFSGKDPPLPTHGKEKVLVYFTSLRGVRKTYEDCCDVRLILKGLGVRLDERDVSMHSGFKDELKELMGDGFYGGGLPRVFVGRKYIGSADEIRRMHEEGQLEKAVEGCEKADDGGGCGRGRSCEACGDIRFVPCETCSGSCKVYCEVGDYEEEEYEEEECGFQRCRDCNENGLIRCPICFD